MRSPIARPRPKETPLRNPVKDPGPVATATLVILLSCAMRGRCAMSSGSRDGMNPCVDPPPSIVAIAAMVDDVSMTKITLRPDQATIAAKVLNFNQTGAGQAGAGQCGARRLEAVAPLDHDRSLVQQLLDPEVDELRRALDAIQVEMRQLDPTGIEAHQLEGGARHRRGRSHATRDASDESGLPRPQLTCQQDQVTGAQAFAEALAGRLGLRGGARRDLLRQSGRSRAPQAACPPRWRRPRALTRPRS